MALLESIASGLRSLLLRVFHAARAQSRWLLPRHVGAQAGTGLLASLPEHFEPRVYLRKYPDLIRAGLSRPDQALEHFRRHGSKEGRTGQFNDAFYRHYYADLTPALSSRAECIRHWLRFGASEGRSPTLSDLLAAEDCPPSIAALVDEFDPPPLPGTPPAERWRTLVDILTAKSTFGGPVWGVLQRDEDFYLTLVRLYDEALQDHRAKPLALALYDRHQGLMSRVLGNISLRTARSTGNPGARAGACKAARAHLAEAVRLTPECPLAHLSMAGALSECGLAEEALESARRAFALSPDRFDLETAFANFARHYFEAQQASLEPLAVQGKRGKLFQQVQASTMRLSEEFVFLLTHGTGSLVRPKVERRRVLLIADLFLAQCRRYRVEQKQEQLEAVGLEVEVVGWPDTDRAFQALHRSDQIIFYRCPATFDVVRLMSTARVLGKLVIYEIDDLVFDPAYPPPIETYGGLLEPATYLSLLKGAAMFRAAAQLADFGIASTLPLQRALSPLVRRGTCFLHRNGLDRHSPLGRTPRRHTDREDLVIFYGTATLAHNSDFVEGAWPGIKRALMIHSRARLRVVGHLKLPEAEMRDLGPGRIERLPACDDLNEYWSLLGEADINIATLTPDPVTNGKSELKWFESAVLGVPSVLSATENYRDVIRHGEDALLATDPEEWFAMLDRLLSDAGQRQRLADTARARVLEQYSVQKLAENLRRILDECARQFQEAPTAAIVP